MDALVQLTLPDVDTALEGSARLASLTAEASRLETGLLEPENSEVLETVKASLVMLRHRVAATDSAERVQAKQEREGGVVDATAAQAAAAALEVAEKEQGEQIAALAGRVAATTDAMAATELQTTLNVITPSLLECNHQAHGEVQASIDKLRGTTAQQFEEDAAMAKLKNDQQLHIKLLLSRALAEITTPEEAHARAIDLETELHDLKDALVPENQGDPLVKQVEVAILALSQTSK
jgi:hypothetical protein